MYNIGGTASYESSYRQIIKGSAELEKRTNKAVYLLAQNPFYPSLHTHKVDTRNFGVKYSSNVTGDIRIIWDFDKKERKLIILYAIGPHTGKHKVYK